MKISKPTYMRVIAKPEDFSPSHGDSEVIGAFNSGATTIETPQGLEILLLVRVAETHKQIESEDVMVPRWDYKTNGSLLVFDKISKNSIIKQSEKEIKYLDLKDGKIKTRLRHISRLERRILGDDGTLKKWGRESILLEYDFAEYGMEDPRITRFGEETAEKLKHKYGVTYVCPHDLHRVSTGIMLTNDFKKFTHLPLGNTPRPVKNGKDMALLPDRYLSTAENILTRKKELEFGVLVRPSEHEGISTAGIALEYSPNLVAMGLPHRLIENQNGIITGTGAPPVKIGDKLISPYHDAIPYKTGEDGKQWHTHYYETKCLEMDAKEPWKASIIPDFCLRREDFLDILPEQGFVPNVVYTIAMIINEQKTEARMFHGVCDTWEAETGHDINY
ncbi:MAG: hypothetical protein ABIH25_02525 [Candidatus Woesearchaeota archaeon]